MKNIAFLKSQTYQQIINDPVKIIRLIIKITFDYLIIVGLQKLVLNWPHQYQPIKNILNYLNEQTSNIQAFQVKQQINPKLIGTLEQKEQCNAIVFDPKGNIMVSACGNKIKIWNFQNNLIQDVNSLLKHQKKLLVWYIAKQAIILFLDQVMDHLDYGRKRIIINDLVLNLIVRIINGFICRLFDQVWSIDFINNKLTFLYSLLIHTSDVNSISLNESETVLVSCGHDSLIIIWQKDVENQWAFYEFVIMIENIISFKIMQNFQKQIIFKYVINRNCFCDFYRPQVINIRKWISYQVNKEDYFIWLPPQSNILCVY
ncbi:unnamed protein product [Paramecium octaurelia]|uniref:Uncharacterized protein n=1 Tax=Paramecium octaurelia TaxID=43137 RepID=A0A8S1UEK4_PAROT|nr:unnamed protein product [Paramecium octaurelia]